MNAILDSVRRDAIRSEAIEALLELPQHIDRYEIRGELGRGGMGIVYDALDPQLKRAVAIKVINPALLSAQSDDSLLEVRFRREMQAVSPIIHPNVVTILDAGIAMLGNQRVAFYVMERISGETLEDRLRRTGPFDRDELLSVAVSVARGLAALHARGIVHRDVKPSNVLLPIDGTPKVSDFGLIHLINDSESVEEKDVIAGSAHGLAPEQIHSGDVDERADLFALGALMIRTWTGREPFAGSDINERLRRIEFSEPEGLESVPAEFASLVRALLAKAPNDRPRSTNDVVQQLEALQHRSRPTFRAVARAVVALSFSGIAALLVLSEWRGLQLDKEIAHATKRHEVAIRAQVERATILAQPLLAPSMLKGFPADERRASHDRLEGIANRLAFERNRHAEQIEMLERERWVRPLRFAFSRSESSRLMGSARSLTEAYFVTQNGSPRHLSPEEIAELSTQLKLVEREFGLRIHVHIESSNSELVTTDVEESQDARLSPLQLRIHLDPLAGAGRIELSRSLEPLFSDALAGALLREQILPLMRRGETAFGLRLAFRVVRDHLHHILLNEELDSKRFEEPIAPPAFTGGGALAHYEPESAGLPSNLDSSLRPRFDAAQTVEETWARFLDWLALETHDTEIGILTTASQEMVRNWPASRPYWRFLKRESLHQTGLAILERDDVALLYGGGEFEMAPIFFRRSPMGWQLDLVANNAHLIAIAGSNRRWTFRNVVEEPLARFRDQLVIDDGLIRLATRTRIPFGTD